MHATKRGASETSYANRLLKYLLILLGLLLLTHLLFQFLNLNVYHQQNGQVYELSNRFDFDDEASVPTWFSQALFLSIGLLSLLASYLQTTKSARRLWGIFAVIGFVVSLDEIAGLHERFLQSIHVWFFKDSAPSEFANAWLLVAPLVMTAMLWLGLTAWRLLPRRTSILFITAGVTYVFGAMLFDLIISVVPRENFLNQGVLVALEETLEQLGVVIAVYAVADYFEKLLRANSERNQTTESLAFAEPHGLYCDNISELSGYSSRMKKTQSSSMNPGTQAVMAFFLLVASILASRGEVMNDWEIHLFDFIYHTPEFLYPFFLAITQFGSIYVFLVLIIFYTAKKHYHIVLRMLMTGTLAYLLAGFIKDLWGRPRPSEFILDVINLDYIRGPGFPSGHMALATAVALTMGHYLPRKYHWIVPVWIIGVGYSRIYLGVHAPLDIIGGFAIGWLSYALFRQVRLYDISFARNHSKMPKTRNK